MGDSRITRGFGRYAPLALAVSLLMAPAVAADEAGDAWAALAKGGHVVLIRHGNAPPGYGGDPPGFKISDCSTQRNLDELGRDQQRYEQGKGQGTEPAHTPPFTHGLSPPR